MNSFVASIRRICGILSANPDAVALMVLVLLLGVGRDRVVSRAVAAVAHTNSRMIQVDVRTMPPDHGRLPCGELIKY